MARKQRAPSKQSSSPLNPAFAANSGYPSAVKRMISYQIERELIRQDISRLQLAEAMNTSRAAINRLLDPDNHSVTLQTLERVAELLGRRLQVFFQE